MPSRTLSNNGSLGSPQIRSYLLSLVRDIFRAYPEIDGLRLDWPEYPPYFLDDLFTDFSEHAAGAAADVRVVFNDARKEASQWYGRLHGQLTNANCEKEIASFARLQGGSWTRIKRAMVNRLLEEVREVMDETGGRDKELVPNAFPPPFNYWSGIAPNVVAEPGRAADAISVKFYTMHWPMMMRFYAEALLKANSGLDERRVVPALARWLKLADEGRYQSLADCRYPEPDEPHGVSAKAMAAKAEEARFRFRGAADRVYGLAHGYGPPADFRDRLQALYRAMGGRIWINRYGYLSDAKLDLIKEVCR